MPHLLVVLREGSIGGAERLVLDSLPSLGEAFEVELTTTPLPGERGEPLTPEDRMKPGLVLRGRADLLYTHLVVPGLLARIGRAFGSRARWVHMVHFDSYDTLPLGRLLRWLDRRWVLPGADRVVAVSPRVADALTAPEGGGLGGVRLLENALALTPAHPPADELERASGPIRLGTVAMLRAEKGIDDLLRALAVLVERGVDATLRVAGDGPERERLERLTEDLGLSERVTFLGFVSPVDEAYRGLDVYLQPSRAESFGLAALESLRYATPLVVSPAGNLPVCAGGGDFGRVADPELPREIALADAVQEVLADRSEWVERAERGRRFWAGQLDGERRLEREVEILRGALLPRVVHVAPLVTHGEGGGLQRQVLLQTRALDAAGHRVFILQRPDPDFRNGDDREERRRRWAHTTRWETGAEGLSGRGSAVRERWLGLRFLLGAIPSLLLRSGRYDVIHAHQLFSPTLVGAVVKTLTGKPLVVRVTASGEGVGEVSQLQRLPFRRARLWALRRIDAAIALTEAMRDELVGAGIAADRVHVIPNSVAIPPEPLTQPRRTGGPYTLLFAGRVSEEKRLDTAIRALAELAARGLDVRLRVVGRADLDRDRSDDLHRLAEELEVSELIEWTGFRPDPEVERAAADAFLLPSRSEGMSNALLEAAAEGMVCVVSDIPQNRAVVSDRGALYFPVGDHEELAGAVAELIRDRDNGGRRASELAGAARARVMARNAPERVAEQVAEIYRRLSTED